MEIKEKEQLRIYEEVLNQEYDEYLEERPRKVKFTTKWYEAEERYNVA
jgi:hypothetical protein